MMVNENSSAFVEKKKRLTRKSCAEEIVPVFLDWAM